MSSEKNGSVPKPRCKSETAKPSGLGNVHLVSPNPTRHRTLLRENCIVFHARPPDLPPLPHSKNLTKDESWRGGCAQFGSVTRIGETGGRTGKGDVEVDEKCKGPRKTAKSGEVSQRYRIYCETHLLTPRFFSPSPSLCSPRSFSLLYMLPCSPSSLALCATSARTSLVLVIYHIVSHAVRFPFILASENFSTQPISQPFRSCIVLELLQHHPRKNHITSIPRLPFLPRTILPWHRSSHSY